MKKQEGLKQIDDAEWLADKHQTLNLYVNDANDRRIHCWLTLRPHYCDRGHIMFAVDGSFNIDAADSFPRYFFDFSEADNHVRRFLKWRIWQVSQPIEPALWGKFCKSIDNPLEYMT